jgi:hypothetical protein
MAVTVPRGCTENVTTAHREGVHHALHARWLARGARDHRTTNVTTSAPRPADSAARALYPRTAVRTTRSETSAVMRCTISPRRTPRRTAKRTPARRDV